MTLSRMDELAVAAIRLREAVARVDVARTNRENAQRAINAANEQFLEAECEEANARNALAQIACRNDDA